MVEGIARGSPKAIKTGGLTFQLMIHQRLDKGLPLRPKDFNSLHSSEVGSFLYE